MAAGITPDIARVLIDEETIRARVRSLAREIAAHYEREQEGLTLVPILSGAIIFVADLIRQMPLKMKIALVRISTYRDQVTPGQPETLIRVDADVRGRHVLIVDDILDSGGTLGYVQAMLRERQPASLRTVVLLRKPGKAPPHVKVDFVGFDIEDLFVVGYGLDCADYYRNFPHIGVLRPELMP